MYYSANWQLLEEYVDRDHDPELLEPDDEWRFMYVWGPRYIDDIVARKRTNLDNQGTTVWYHLTDALFSTVAIIEDTARLVERVSYDAYGRARHHRPADLTGDGAVTTGSSSGTDQKLLEDNLGLFGVGDLNRDGIVDNDDLTLLLANAGAALAEGQISSTSTTSTDNQIGYAGYVFNREHPGGGLYTVRHRTYNVDLGRWNTRDPIGYVDGMNLYEYVKSRPTTAIDTLGLSPFVPLLDALTSSEDRKCGTAAHLTCALTCAACFGSIGLTAVMLQAGCNQSTVMTPACVMMLKEVMPSLVGIITTSCTNCIFCLQQAVSGKYKCKNDDDYPLANQWILRLSGECGCKLKEGCNSYHRCLKDQCTSQNLNRGELWQNVCHSTNRSDMRRCDNYRACNHAAGHLYDACKETDYAKHDIKPFSWE